MASEFTKRDVQSYLEGIEYPASQQDLLSAAKGNDAPQGFIERLEDIEKAAGLGERPEFSSSEEVLEALGRLEPPEDAVAERF